MWKKPQLLYDKAVETKDFVKGLVKMVARKRYRKITGKYPKIEAVVVDVDGTLLKGNSYKGLTKPYPAVGIGTEELFQQYNLGKISSNDVFAGYANLLAKNNVAKKDIEKYIVRQALEAGRANRALISALHYLKKKGIKVFIATRSSGSVAQELCRAYKFDGFIGSNEIFDKQGKMNRVNAVVGVKDNFKGKIPVYSKMTLLQKKYGINPKKVAMVTDEFSDTTAMSGARYGILFNPKEPISPKLTLKSLNWHAYDAKLNEIDPKFREKFVTMILHPETQKREKLLTRKIERVPPAKLRKSARIR